MIPQRFVWLGLLALWAISHAAVLAQDPEKKVVAPAEKIRQALEKPVTVEFTGQSLGAALEHLREKANLPLSIDQVTLAQHGIAADDNSGQVEIKAKNEKAGQVLRKVLNAYRLAYVILDDALLITSEEAATQRQLKQRISIDVNDVPLRQAARDLARIYGINVVFDPRVAKSAQAPITLQLDSVPLETTIRLMAELADDVKSVRVGNVLFITTPQRAEKIRLEEGIGEPLENLLRPIPGLGFGAGALELPQLRQKAVEVPAAPNAP